MILVLLLSGCSIKQEARPVTEKIGTNICIIEDTKVKEGFLSAFKRTLEQLGYEVTIISQGNSSADCEIISTYMGLWSWDLAIYMSYATIKVHKNGKLVGEVTYDSRSGGANPNKFVNGDEKIQELVKQVFPNIK